MALKNNLVRFSSREENFGVLAQQVRRRNFYHKMFTFGVLDTRVDARSLERSVPSARSGWLAATRSSTTVHERVRSCVRALRCMQLIRKNAERVPTRREQEDRGTLYLWTVRVEGRA